MGMMNATLSIQEPVLTALIRLLQSPFDFSQAFDQALKNIVAALPNRPAIESSEDAVGPSIIQLLGLKLTRD